MVIEMDELIKNIDNLNKTLLEFNVDLKLTIELMDRCNNDMDQVHRLLIAKKIEDGIIDAFYNATYEQLETLKRNYYWKYYKKDYVNDLIDKHMKNRKRRDKLRNLEKES
jgi:hypothetical protein